MKYHLCKATRIYGGEPYNGPSSNGMNAEAETLEEAKIMADKLNERNPVGWNIWDSETGKIVIGNDFFSE